MRNGEPGKWRALSVMVLGLGLLALAVGCVSVQSPRRPNLAAAQQFVQRAIDKISAAQAANTYDMKGHAASAKALLEQARSEIDLAVQAANAK